MLIIVYTADLVANLAKSWDLSAKASQVVLFPEVKIFNEKEAQKDILRFSEGPLSEVPLYTSAELEMLPVIGHFPAILPICLVKTQFGRTLFLFHSRLQTIIS